MPMDSLEQIIFTWEKLKDYIYFLRLTNSQKNDPTYDKIIDLLNVLLLFSTLIERIFTDWLRE